MKEDRQFYITIILTVDEVMDIAVCQGSRLDVQEAIQILKTLKKQSDFNSSVIWSALDDAVTDFLTHLKDTEKNEPKKSRNDKGDTGGR